MLTERNRRLLIALTEDALEQTRSRSRASVDGAIVLEDALLELAPHGRELAEPIRAARASELETGDDQPRLKAIVDVLEDLKIQMDEATRRRLIDLARQALEAFEVRPPDESASVALEEMLRVELPPSAMYRADRLAESRGYFQERAMLRYILEYLEALPWERRVARTEARVMAMVTHAWKRGVVSRDDESRMPFLRYYNDHIRSLLRTATQTGSRAAVLAELRRNAFRYHSSERAVDALVGKIATAIIEEERRP